MINTIPIKIYFDYYISTKVSNLYNSSMELLNHNLVHHSLGTNEDH